MEGKPKVRSSGRTDRYSVSIGLLAIMIVAFLVGGATYGLIQNASEQQLLSFSTPALLGFVLSIILSGASIVLAIVAITLGRFSEDAITRRSDESIRLQNEVFQKTTDALQRIESSTGVTEKRIEDIISGRVGDVSHKIAQFASEKQGLRSQLEPQAIEDLIRRGLFRRQFEESEGRQQQERKLHQEYQALHMRALRAFSRLEDLRAIKMHHGNPSSAGEDLFDGIFGRADGTKLSVSTFRKDLAPESLREFVVNALVELRKGSVQHVYALLFEPNGDLEGAYREAVAVGSPELTGKMTLLICPAERIDETIGSLNLPGHDMEATE